MQTKRARAATALAVLLGLAGVVYAQRTASPAPGADTELAKAVATRAKLPVKTVQDVIDALAPEILLQIERGGIVTLPKFGTIRLVRVGEHKDMERGNGRVFTVPARNFITVDAEGEVDKAVNTPGIQVNEVVPQFQYNVLPGQTPSQKAGSLKTRSTRSP